MIKFSSNAKKIAIEVKAYKEALEKRIEKMLDDLADRARQTAQAYYGSAVTVVVQKPSRWERNIVASGQAVMFLEFGAGTRTDVSHPYANADEMPPIIFPGSYSGSHAHQFVDNGWWFFGGKYYTYVTPTRALYHAMDAAVAEAEKQAAEIEQAGVL